MIGSFKKESIFPANQLNHKRFIKIGKKKFESTHVFVVVERVEDVVRQTGEQVDDEPALEVVHADDFGVGDDFAVGSDEGRVEIENDVDEEDDVDDRVDDQQTDVLRRLVLEGHVVGHHDGRVEGEAEDDPVPQGLKGAVVQQDVRRRFGGLLAVLRQDVRIQAHHLFSPSIKTQNKGDVKKT